MRLCYILNIGVCPVLTLGNGLENYSQPLIERARGYLANTRAYFSCNAGYVLSGTRSITCNSDGQAWNLIPPICTKGIKSIQCISLMFYKETWVKYIFVINYIFIFVEHTSLRWTLAMYTQGFKIKFLLTFRSIFTSGYNFISNTLSQKNEVLPTDNILFN